MTSIDWGSVPDWLAGSGALAALWWARRAARAAAATNRQQADQIAQLEQEQRKREDEQRRAQASKIAVWFRRPKDEDESKWTRYPVCLSNASDLPVIDVVVSVAAEGNHWASIYAIQHLPPTIELRHPAIDSVVGATLRHFQPDELDRQIPVEEQVTPADFLAIAFTDMNGRRWSRDMNGELIEIHAKQKSKYDDRPEAEPRTLDDVETG